MKRVMIIDDEMSARKLLRGVLTDAKYNLDVEIVGEAADGIEAVEMFRALLPDIVFLDVDMPFKDGITAMREMQTINRNVKVIIVTGHHRFDYAQKALNSGASFLQLKPIAEDELADMARSICSEIDEDLARKAKWNQISSIMQENMPMMRCNFIKTIVKGEFDNDSTLEETAKIYDIDIAAKKYFVACISPEHRKGTAAGDINKAFLAVDNIIKSVSEERDYRSYSYISEQNRMVVLFCCHDIKKDEKESLINELQIAAGNFVKDKLYWGLGSITDDIKTIKSSYYGAVQALSYKSVFVENSVTDSIDTGLLDSSRGYYLGSDIEDVLDAFQSGEVDEAADKVREMYKNMEGMPKAYAKNLALEIITVLRRGFTEMDLDIKTIADCEGTILQKDTDATDVEELSGLIIKLIYDIYEQRRNLLEQRLSKKIMLAKEFIEANYTDPSFCLQYVSDYVSLSTAYFCSLFFSQVGIHFNEYLTYVRVEKAKELLREGVIKIYEIAFAIGFNDPKYFSSKFKKLVGISPSEYRENTP